MLPDLNKMMMMIMIDQPRLALPDCAVRLLLLLLQWSA